MRPQVRDPIHALQEVKSMRTLLLWAVGVPLPIIALYWIFG